ncbi:MAG: hypothetical protein ACLFS6_06565 [Methanomassiliicoccales archaeon]
MGLLIDRIGARSPYIIGLLLYGIGGGSGPSLDPYLPLLVSRALLDIAVALIFTSITVILLNL